MGFDQLQRTHLRRCRIAGAGTTAAARQRLFLCAMPAGGGVAIGGGIDETRRQ